MQSINYYLIAETIRHYEKFGFQRLDVNWLANSQVWKEPEHMLISYMNKSNNLIYNGANYLFPVFYQDKENSSKLLYETSLFLFQKDLDTCIDMYKFLTNSILSFVTQYRSDIKWQENKDYSGEVEHKIIHSSQITTSGGTNLGNCFLRQLDELYYCYGSGVSLPNFDAGSTLTI